MFKEGGFGQKRGIRTWERGNSYTLPSFRKSVHNTSQYTNSSNLNKFVDLFSSVHQVGSITGTFIW